VLRVTEPVEVLFYAGGTFHLRGETESLQADIIGKADRLTE